MTLKVIAVVSAASLLLAVDAGAAASPTPAATPACRAPEFRQFDFWLGSWRVTNPKGVEVGTSEISRVSEGCAVREQWTSANGQGGTSLNYYDESDGEWHQDWVGGDGTILHLHGGRRGKAMILSNKVKTHQGTLTNRITYTPQPGGKVRQEWAISTDGGATWQVSFLGLYKKVTK